MLIIVRAMTAFYLAVGSFAFGTMMALLGATILAQDLVPIAASWAMSATVAACVVGVAAIMAGSLGLVFESRLTFRILRVEADLARERYARKQTA